MVSLQPSCINNWLNIIFRDVGHNERVVREERGGGLR